jgi:hypothetical protein
LVQLNMRISTTSINKECWYCCRTTG